MSSYFFVLRESTCWEGTIDHINIISPTPTLEGSLLIFNNNSVCLCSGMYFTTKLLVNNKSAIIYSTAEQ